MLIFPNMNNKKLAIIITTNIIEKIFNRFFIIIIEIMTNFKYLFFQNIIMRRIIVSFLVMLALILINPRVVKKIPFYFKPKRALNIVFTSINDGLANIFAFMAYQIGRNALQIGPLASTQTIVTVLLALIILREIDNMFQKIFGAIIAVIGTILLL